MAERVQAYTHPFWFLLLSLFSFVGANVFYSTFVLSILISLLTLILFFIHIARHSWWGVLMGMVLVVSTAFTDFSTSGLENPLTHLLLALFFIIINRRPSTDSDAAYQQIVLLVLTCSALYLTRPDAVLLILPSMLWEITHTPIPKKKCLRAMLFGAFPVILWTLFSLIYYGFLYPNTAYAKLAAGVPWAEKVSKGMVYFKYAWHNTLLVNLTILAGVIIGIGLPRSRQLLLLGVLVYLSFLLTIGGDFMQGRMLTPPFFLVCMILSQIEMDKEQYFTIIVGISFGLLVSIPAHIGSASLLYGGRWVAKGGFVNERAFYFQSTGLLVSPNHTFKLNEALHFGGGQRIVCGLLGFSAIEAGLNTHFIDACALADPLLSRLPYNQSKNWRPGHLYRDIPLGYPESIKYGRNYIQDKKVNGLYDKIRLITRGDIFSAQRFKEIIKINFGLG